MVALHPPRGVTLLAALLAALPVVHAQSKTRIVAAPAPTPPSAASPAPATAAGPASSTSPFHFATAPADTDSVVIDSLERTAVRSAPEILTSTTLEVKPPLAIYSLNFDAIANGKGLESSTANGLFACVVYDAGWPAGWVWVRIMPDGGARMSMAGYASQNRMPGIIGAGLERMAALGVEEPLRKGSYEVRFLEGSGSVGISALWLRSTSGGSDYVLRLGSANPNYTIAPDVAVDKLYSASEFLKIYRPFLQQQMGLPIGPLTWKSEEKMNWYFVDRFIASSGNGISRIPAPQMTVSDKMRIVFTEPAPPDSDKLPATQAYKIDRLELIGIAEHNPPVAFVKSRHETRAANFTTRPLTDFEQQAVTELCAGKNILAQADKDGRVVVGPIRAEQSCLDCHSDSKVGDVLGALAFHLTPVSAETASAP